ncbi:MAG: DNA repair protein RecO [Candidatus Manganitrophus sp.]|nr:MAG: DNA repair protein RecO [Candidatus Manganitrophus sp.]
MSLLTTPAIVLGSIKLGEADKLVTFFTAKKGKLKGVAKGARRVKSRFGASLEPFTHCTLVVFEKPGDKLARVNQSDIVHSFQKLRENWGEIHLASHMAHLVQRMTPEGEQNLLVYRLLLEGLTFLERGADPELSTLLFVVRLVSFSGYQPRWDRCLKCHRPMGERIYFSPADGGTVSHPMRPWAAGDDLAGDPRFSPGLSEDGLYRRPSPEALPRHAVGDPDDLRPAYDLHYRNAGPRLGRGGSFGAEPVLIFLS